MGYDTTFEGRLKFNKTLDPELREYLNLFSKTRRMQRDPEVIPKIDPEWKKRCYHGNLGEEGEYYVQRDSYPKECVRENRRSFDCLGQVYDLSVMNYNQPPKTQPGLWCQWTVYTEENGSSYLEWDGNEKFYEYVEWLQYLIDNFFQPEGYLLSGAIKWYGEDPDDLGMIEVKDNVVKVLAGYIEYR